MKARRERSNPYGMANPGSAGLAALQIDSWRHPFTRKTLAELGVLLPDFLAARRWFRAKARSIRETAAEDVLEADGAWILVVQVGYSDGGSDRYLVPVAIDRGAGFTPRGASAPHLEILASLESPDGEAGVLYSALWDSAFRDTLLRALALNGAFRGSKGDLFAERTRAFEDESSVTGKLESSLIKAEQSNSSIVYGGRYILKLFRKLEPGVNPDAEMGVFLTERGFRYTPEVLGTLQYGTKSETYSAGILQRFVKNRGDAWAFTLESLSGFFHRATGGAVDAYAPEPKSFHPLDLSRETPPAEVRELLGPFAGKIRMLGQRTAEMHAALCDPDAGPDFAPEPFTREAAAKAHAGMVAEANIVFELVRRKQAALPEDVAAGARELLRLEYRVAELFSRFRDFPVSALRIRHHGDFHLGQVLYTGDDFMIIDFEGEPSRPLSDRRAKALALRDVAGMIRSFQYAAYAALFAEFPDAAARQEDIFPALESWAVCWSAWVSGLYVSAYFSAAGEGAFAGASEQERRVLLDAFLLEKVLYEVG
ncbi:MAG: putative maltokinase, partial [Bryobacteraceae bacterium]